MALPAVMLGLQISGWVFFLRGAMQGHCDFRQLYTAGYMVRTGHRSELYDYGLEHRFQDNLVSREAIALPFNHLAYEALLFVPYSYLSYRAAYFLFLATNIALLALAIHLFAPWTRHLRGMFLWLPTALFFTFLPVAAAFMQGQDSIVLLVLFCGALLLLSQEKMFVAGLLIGLGLFKFQIVLPVALLFLLWRRWRFVVGFAASSATVFAISWGLVGTPQMNVYAGSLLSMSVRETIADQAKFNVNPNMMPNLRGLVSSSIGGIVPAIGVQILTGAASVAILVWIARRGMRSSLPEQLALAITTGAALSYHLFIHDLSILLIPVLFVLNHYSARDPSGPTLTVAGALMFAAPAVIALSDLRPFVIAVPLLLLLALQSRPGREQEREIGAT